MKIKIVYLNVNVTLNLKLLWFESKNSTAVGNWLAKNSARGKKETLTILGV